MESQPLAPSRPLFRWHTTPPRESPSENTIAEDDGAISQSRVYVARDALGRPFIEDFLASISRLAPGWARSRTPAG